MPALTSERRVVLELSTYLEKWQAAVTYWFKSIDNDERKVKEIRILLKDGQIKLLELLMKEVTVEEEGLRIVSEHQLREMLKELRKI